MKDIEIAQENEANAMLPIQDIAKKIGLNASDLELYGNYKAKLSLKTLKALTKKKPGKLVLVTSINPTPAGEGKSTVTIGLADALNRLDQHAMIALREPSLGPVMGLKGGATGGGYAQVVPMEDINLHFTGDMHALTSANDTLAALIDNHIQQGNELQIDPRRIQWKRAVDVNDRALRQIVIGLGGPTSGVPRQDGFQITVASELMAVLCLATDLEDLKTRIANIVIGYSYSQQPITVADLKVEGAITMLLRDAIKPNLVQTLEHTPTLIHGGPFANIAHGCNSIIATQAALEMSDITVTEAGFGSDLGGEKFMDIVTQRINKTPDATVIVATIRALKYNAGIEVKDLQTPNLPAVKEGYQNLSQHIKSMKQYGAPVVVAINRFISDSDEEIKLVKELCAKQDVLAVETNVWEKGGAGALDLAKAVIDATKSKNDFKLVYSYDDDVVEKLTKITQKVYGGRGVILSATAKKNLKTINENGWNKMPICVAKTQYSLSDDAKVHNAPQDFNLHVRELVPDTGAGFIVALTGNVLTMPGLPKHPAALDMDVDADGKISGLF